MESEFSSEFQAQTYQALQSMDIRPMETVLKNFYSPQESQRTEAQRFLECCKKHHPNSLFMNLFFLVKCRAPVEMRANAARVIRFVRVSNLWPTLPEVTQEGLKPLLLDILREEKSIPVLREFRPVVSETVSVIYKGGKKWPELLDFLLNCLGRKDDKFQETSLLVLTYLPKDGRSFISEALSHNIRSLHSSILGALASANPNVQIASFGAVVSLVHLFSDSSNPRFFLELLKAMMEGAFILINTSGYNHAKMAIQLLALLVSENPQLLKPYVSDIVLHVLQIAEAPSVTDEIRCLFINLVMNMTKLKGLQSILLNLPHETLRRLIVIAIKMPAFIEEDMVWNELEREGDMDSSTGKINIHKFGRNCLNQLSINLGESKIVQVASEVLPFYLDSSEWKTRYAGIKMLAGITEKLSNKMILEFLGEVVTKILKLFQDSHFQVQLAIFKFMEMPTRFIQQMHTFYHQRLVTAFVTALDDQNEKVKEQAASALLLFLKKTVPVSLTTHTDVDAVITKFLALLSGNATAKQRFIALLTFNFVAKWCREVAIKHHSNILPVLLEACNDKISEVKGEAIRGIRICAEFRTPEFRHYINRILSQLNLLMKDSNRSLPENTKVYDIAVSALGRICVFHRDSIDSSKLVPAWLSNLPLKNDLVEARIMHEQLCLMVARSHPELSVFDHQNLSKIVEVFLEVIEKGDKLAKAGTVKQMGNLLRQIIQRFPPKTLDEMWSTLNAQQRELLVSVVLSVSWS